MLRRICVLIGLFAAISGVQAQPPQPLSDDAIRQVLVNRIDAEHRGVGIVVGLIDPRGRKVVAHGRFSRDDPRPVDGDTLFEIGSVTKVFTSLLLADMVRRGEIALDDPVAKYLPPQIKVPERGGRQITLQDLATHTSGLPRLPDNMRPRDPANPYADYTVEQLYQFLSDYTLTRDIGAHYEYSNLGAGLLGHALSRRAGMDYEALVASRIAEPLGMASTRIALAPDMKSRLAAGHNQRLEPIPNWDLPTFAGAGALRSSANDMLIFLAAFLGEVRSPLAPAMQTMLTVRRPTGTPGLDIALAWHVLKSADAELIWHNGFTGGYRCFIGYSPQRRVGVVVLTNSAFSPDDIALHVINPRNPLIGPPKPRTEIAIDPNILDRYLGRYQLAPNFILTVTREGAKLGLQATGQQKFALYAESEQTFFVKDFDAQITFETDATGRATRLILHQFGRDMPAWRME